MRFNSIIKNLIDYRKKPEISMKTMKEVVFIFLDSMSGLEREMFLKKCKNFDIDLYFLLNSKDVQVEMNRFFKKQERLSEIKI